MKMIYKENYEGFANLYIQLKRLDYYRAENFQKLKTLFRDALMGAKNNDGNGHPRCLSCINGTPEYFEVFEAAPMTKSEAAYIRAHDHIMDCFQFDCGRKIPQPQGGRTQS